MEEKGGGDESHAAQEQDRYHQRWLSACKVAVDNGFVDSEDCIDESQPRDAESQVRRGLEGRDGERGEPLQGEIPERPVIPLGDAGEARIAPIHHRHGREADSGEQAFHVAVVLAQFQRRVEHAPAEQSEFADVRGILTGVTRRTRR